MTIHPPPSQTLTRLIPLRVTPSTAPPPATVYIIERLGRYNRLQTTSSPPLLPLLDRVKAAFTTSPILQRTPPSGLLCKLSPTHHIAIHANWTLFVDDPKLLAYSVVHPDQTTTLLVHVTLRDILAALPPALTRTSPDSAALAVMSELARIRVQEAAAAFGVVCNSLTVSAVRIVNGHSTRSANSPSVKPHSHPTKKQPTPPRQRSLNLAHLPLPPSVADANTDFDTVLPELPGASVPPPLPAIWSDEDEADEETNPVRNTFIVPTTHIHPPRPKLPIPPQLPRKAVLHAPPPSPAHQTSPTRPQPPLPMLVPRTSQNPAPPARAHALHTATPTLPRSEPSTERSYLGPAMRQTSTTPPVAQAPNKAQLQALVENPFDPPVEQTRSPSDSSVTPDQTTTTHTGGMQPAMFPPHIASLPAARPASPMAGGLHGGGSVSSSDGETVDDGGMQAFLPEDSGCSSNEAVHDKDLRILEERVLPEDPTRWRDGAGWERGTGRREGYGVSGLEAGVGATRDVLPVRKMDSTDAHVKVGKKKAGITRTKTAAGGNREVEKGVFPGGGVKRASKEKVGATRVGAGGRVMDGAKDVGVRDRAGVGGGRGVHRRMETRDGGKRGVSKTVALIPERPTRVRDEGKRGVSKTVALIPERPTRVEQDGGKRSVSKTVVLIPERPTRVVQPILYPQASMVRRGQVVVRDVRKGGGEKGGGGRRKVEGGGDVDKEGEGEVLEKMGEGKRGIGGEGKKSLDEGSEEEGGREVFVDADGGREERKEEFYGDGYSSSCSSSECEGCAQEKRREIRRKKREEGRGGGRGKEKRKKGKKKKRKGSQQRKTGRGMGGIGMEGRMMVEYRSREKGDVKGIYRHREVDEDSGIDHPIPWYCEGQSEVELSSCGEERRCGEGAFSSYGRRDKFGRRFRARHVRRVTFLHDAQ